MKFLLFLIPIINICFPQEHKTLIPLVLKQRTEIERYFSNDGKNDYYQKNTGPLMFSTNYNVTELIKGKPGSYYQITPSDDFKYLAIERNENHQSLLHIRKNKKLFLTTFGSKEAIEIGDGVKPKVFLDGKYYIYYNQNSRTIFSVFPHDQLLASKLNFKIELNNKTNKYFTPDYTMKDEGILFYTDINDNGITGVFEFNKNENKTTNIYKSDSINTTIELTSCQERIYLGVFNNGSQILEYNGAVNEKKPKFTSLYSSNLNDTGNMKCFDGQLFFIKQIENKFKRVYKLVSINLDDKKLIHFDQTEAIEKKENDSEVKNSFNIQKELDFVTSFFIVDKILVVPFRGEYFYYSKNKVELLGKFKK